MLNLTLVVIISDNKIEWRNYIEIDFPVGTEDTERKSVKYYN